ncbi:MAG: triose-phosphate isomerase [Crenarchaeota archaeon]|nr:triose-phosphate isomerase [Thermoproteota archaeon]MCR8454801.1 triose-phosphate isomerase [Thermoproteota archaeon]
MKKPLIILNLKAYKEAFDEGLEILNVVENVAHEFPQISFVLAPNAFCLSEFSKKKRLVKIYSQHVDPVPLGAYTGHLPLEAIKILGADGTIINHSERPISIEAISQIIDKSRSLGIETLACARDLKEVSKIAALRPDYVAFEPPELIGTGVSVSKAKPNDLKMSVVSIVQESDGKSIPICGAGISTEEDVKLAFSYGVMGVLISSAFVKASDKRNKLFEFASAVESAFF